MPATQPSQARVGNVIAAMKKAGLEPGEVVVAADGGFTVRVKSVDEAPEEDPKMPRRFQAG